MEDRFGTGIDDLWSALTGPGRLDLAATVAAGPASA
jgi:hypothetical protein